MDEDLEALARASGARLRGAAGPRIEQVSTDSRAPLGPRSLFVALRGPHHDGHAFVAAALAQGAAAMVDAAGCAAYGAAWQGRLLEVPDTLAGLGALAAHRRRQHPGPVVAITGSNGKTTTKELVAQALSPGGPAHRTAGNLNNLVGVPLTLCAWPPGAWAAAVEMGMNAPGELARLAAMAAPQVGIVTNVAAAHLGGPGLGSIAAVARAKAELVAGLAPGATAVLYADDAVLMAAAAPHLAGLRLLRVGAAAAADVRVLAARPRPEGLAVELSVMGAAHAVVLPLHGPHNAVNAGLAVAAAVALGVEAGAAVAALAGVAVPGARLRLGPDVPGRPRLLDDSYNANPGSMATALSTLGHVAGSRRRLAVLGEMLELGPQSERLHAELGQAAAAAGVARLWALGTHAEAVARAARAGGAEASAYATLAPLQADLEQHLGGDDVLLVKGSRGMRLERLVAALVSRLGTA